MGTRKKDPLHGSFFFTSLRPVLTGLWPVLPLGQCSPSKSVTLHQKCLHKSAPSPLVSACRQVTTQPLDRRGILGMVSVYRTYVHYSLQSNSTFSFKHHLTGEAWPACRAILPLDRRGILGMVSVYHTRTSTIAKNRRPGNSCFARLATH